MYVCGGCAVFSVGAAKNRCDFCGDNIQRKRLGHIIIPAIHHSIHLIGIRIAGGQKNDRAGAFFSQLSAPVKSVIRGKIDVQQHQMRLRFLKFALHIEKVLAALNRKAEFL